MMIAYHLKSASLALASFSFSFATAQSSTSGVASGTAAATSTQFTIPADAGNGANILPTVLNETAVQAQNACPGYKASNVKSSEYGFAASLALAGSPCNVYGTDVDALTLTVTVQDTHRLQVNIKPSHLDDKNSSWYILPEHLLDLPKQGRPRSLTDFEFTWTNEPSFAFTVTRKSIGDVVFDTRGSVIVYEDQYIEFVSQLPENYNLYGLGEHMRNIRLGNDYVDTMFAVDNGNPFDRNLYGIHPVYLDTRYYETDGHGKHTLVTTQNTSATGNYISKSHGLYNRNAHGQDVLLQATNITWRAIGGSIDLYFLDGPSAYDVTEQYQNGIVGLPALQQYWSFGFHQCRWGYKNWSMLEDVVENYREANIPLETVWTDIDYMFQYRDFTNDPNTFPYPSGQDFLSRLHANGQHYVPIVDSAIYNPNPNNASDAYPIYDDGHTRDVFMKNPDGSEYIGAVWPGYTVFPDWHASQSQEWWANGLRSHHNNIPWDGIWIDMSEVSSFCTGSCGSNNLTLNPVHPPFGLPGEPGHVDYSYPEGFSLTNASDATTVSAASAAQASAFPTGDSATTSAPYVTAKVTPGARNVNYPPYAINNVLGDLATHAVSPNATHSDGIAEYDVHNLFGHQILNATYQGLLSVLPGKRPFIIGRSQFAGSGKWAGHWGGDNNSLFASMYYSISQALGFAFFGIPMFGVDTCGFAGNTDEELCNRWMQLSAFFPFYRNHNVLAAIPQEAYRWSSVAEASRTAMQIRYSLLPYLYTLFYEAHTTGSLVMRALTWEFPNDPTLANIDNQFLLGPNILVTPVLGQGLTSRGGIFPGVAHGEVWYDWYTQTAVDAQPGVNHTIDAPLGHIPVHIRGGAILPQQEALYTTTECRNSSWSLIAALNKRGTARGQIYLDDGVSLKPDATRNVDLTVAHNSLHASSHGTYQDNNRLANITILGVDSEPRLVKLNGANVDNVHYNNTSKVVSIKGLENLTSKGAWAQDWTLEWSC